VNRLCLGRELVVGPHRILPIEERTVVRHRGAGSAWFFVASRLHALVISTGADVRCLDSAGQPIDLSALLTRLPALAVQLETCRSAAEKATD
jgi:hypothetical protein